MKKFNILLIGAGKAGTAIAYLLKNKGHNIVAAVARTKETLLEASRFLDGTNLIQANEVLKIKELSQKADLLIIATKDDQIKPVCSKLTSEGIVNKNQIVIHLSGASGLSELEDAAKTGSLIASIHPIQTFANIKLAIEKIPGSFFGITADDKAKEIAEHIVRDLDGIPLDIADENKILYHAAACIASNYLVALLDIARQVYNLVGISDEDAIAAMMPLIKGTVDNIEKVGTTNALTGPIIRGDKKTIKNHLKEINLKETKGAEYKNIDSKISKVYKIMGLATVDIAKRKGALSVDDANDIIEILKT